MKKKPEIIIPIIVDKVKAKSYVVVPGACIDCTLKDNCRNDKHETRRFLDKFKLASCGNGNMISVETMK